MTNQQEALRAQPMRLVPLNELSMQSFVRCYAYGELNKVDAADRGNLEVYTLDEIAVLLAHWCSLQLDYYVASKDEHAAESMRLTAQYQHYITRAKCLDALISILNAEFDEVVAEQLRNEPKYKERRLQFAQETYKRDLELIANIERSVKMAFTAIERQYNELKANSRADATSTPDNIADSFTERLFTANEVTGCKYLMHELTARDFALLWSRTVSKIEASLRDSPTAAH